MKVSFQFFLVTILISCSSKESSKNIKSITELTYSTSKKNGEFVRNGSPKEVSYYFDTTGNLLEEVEYGTTKYVSKYDTKGIISETSVYSSSDYLKYKEIYKYDDAGLKVEKIKQSKSNHLIEKTRYYYDEKKNIIEEVILDDTDSLKGKHKYLYNTNNEIILDTTFTKNNLIYEYAYVYNSKGNAIEKSIYSDGELDTKRTCSYASDGNILEEDVYKVDPETEKLKFDKNITFKYDNKGNKIQKKSIDSDNVSWITLYKYDSRGNLIEEIGYNSDNSLERKIFYTYDSINRILTEKCVRADGSDWWSIKYNYKIDSKYEKILLDENEKIESTYNYQLDETGKTLKSTSVDPDGSLHWEITYLYNDSGKLIKQIEYNPNGRGIIFSDDEPELGSDYSGDGIFKVTTLFDYDNKGNKISAEIFYERTLIIGYTYSGYDKFGNWTERTSLYNKEPLKITERKIKYY